MATRHEPPTTVDDVKARDQKWDADSELPSPERRRTVFVAHESDPYDLRRVGIPGNSESAWDVFCDNVCARLHLRVITMVTDMITGAVIDDVYEIRDGDRLEVAGYKMSVEEMQPKYFGEDSIYGYDEPLSEFQLQNKKKELTYRQEERTYHQPTEITHKPEEAFFGTGIEAIDSPTKLATARTAGTGAGAGAGAGAGDADGDADGSGTPTAGTARATSAGTTKSGKSAAAAAAAAAAADGKDTAGEDGEDGAAATEKLKPKTLDVSDLPPGHPFNKLRGSPEMMAAFRRRGRARPPDSLHVIRMKRYQNTGSCSVADIGDILAAMMIKPGDKNVQMEGCQALRDALIRPLDHEEYDEDPVANSVSEQGAIPFVVMILHRHVENVGVVEQALGVLYQVSCVHLRDRYIMVNQGVVAVAINALKEHETHTGIQEQGLLLLGVLASRTADARSVRELGGEAVARKALEAFSGRRGVFEGANMLIRNCRRLDDLGKTPSLKPYYER